MIKRLTAAMVLAAAMLAAPGAAFAAGPNDKTQAWTIFKRLAQHSCEAANRVSEAWGLGILVMCGDDKKVEEVKK